MDVDTGKYNYGFRDYDPMLMRWTTEDPVRDGLNWYVYCGNDPVNFVDPLGLTAEAESDGVSDLVMEIVVDLIQEYFSDATTSILTKEMIGTSELYGGAYLMLGKKEAIVRVTLKNDLTNIVDSTGSAIFLYQIVKGKLK